MNIVLRNFSSTRFQRKSDGRTWRGPPPQGLLRHPARPPARVGGGSARAAGASPPPAPPPLPPPGVSGGRYRAGPAPQQSLQPRARGRLGRSPAGRRAAQSLRSRLVDVAKGSGEAAEAGGRGFAVPTINC